MAASKARALGRIFDIGWGAKPQLLNASGVTGKNISMQNCEGITIIVNKIAVGTTDDFVFQLQQVNGYAGTPKDLAIITDYYVKSETALDNDEAWVKTTQAVATNITAIAGTAELEMLFAVEVRADQLDRAGGYTHIQANLPDFGSTDAIYGSIIYIPWGLKVQRAPENMPSLLRPGVANA